MAVVEMPALRLRGVQLQGVQYVSIDALVAYLTDVAEACDKSDAHQAASDIARAIRDSLRRGSATPA